MTHLDWESIVKKAYNQHAGVKFSILTYHDWCENENDVICMIDKLCEHFSDKMGLTFQYIVHYTNDRINIGPHTDRRWNGIKKRLKADEVDSLEIALDDGNMTYPLFLKFCGRDVVRPLKFINIQFFVAPILMGNDISKEIVQGFKELFVLFDGVYGYMDLLPGFLEIGLTCERTAHEKHAGWEIVTHQEETKNTARGYFWANILTDEHIAALGGEESFVKNVPCSKLEKLHMPNGQTAYYVQLSDNIYDFSQEVYLKFKDFLEPILHKEHLKSVIYEMLIHPDTLQSNRLVFHKGEIENVWHEMEQNGEMRKVLAFLGKLPEGEQHEKVTMRDISFINPNSIF